VRRGNRRGGVVVLKWQAHRKPRRHDWPSRSCGVAGLEDESASPPMAVLSPTVLNVPVVEAGFTSFTCASTIERSRTEHDLGHLPARA
jgi:hypothetical protein